MTARKAPGPADVVTLKAPPRGRAFVKPRLRLDKVVIRLIARLQAALAADAPEDRTVVVTCTAPIRLAGKTAEALEARIRLALSSDTRKDIADTINDNAVRVRVVKARVTGAAAVVGFVHNPDPGAAETLLDMTQALIEALAPIAKPKKHRLVVGNPGAPLGDTWRHVYEALAVPHRYETVAMTFADGSAQTLGD